MKKILLAFFCTLIPFTASWAGYVKVTDASTLVAGDVIVVVASDYDYALSTEQKSSNRGAAAVTKVNDEVTFGNDVQLLTLEAGTVSGTFAFNTGSGYLYAASSSANQLKTKKSLDANGSWEITIADGVATIIAQGSNNNKLLSFYYTNSNQLFNCYATNKLQKKISIYKLVEETGNTPAAPEFNVESGDFENSFSLTISAGSSTIHYTLDGTAPTADSDVYTAPLFIGASVTVKAVAVDANGVESDIVETAYTKTDDKRTAELVTDASKLAAGDVVAVVAANYDKALSVEQKTNNRAAAEIVKSGDSAIFDENVQLLTLEAGAVEGTFAFNTGDGYLYAASSKDNHLKTKATLDATGSWSVAVADGIASVVSHQENNNNLRYNSTSDLFSCYVETSTQKAVALYKYTPVEYTLAVSAAGWATLCLDYNAVIPSGVNVYYVSAIDDDSAKLTEIKSVVPANAAVIVKAAQGYYKFAVSKVVANIGDNYLEGSIFNKYIASEAYLLAKPSNEEIGFYPAELAGGVFLNNANRAYLSLPAGMKSNGFSLRFDDGETTAVESVEGDCSEPTIYTIGGVRVDSVAAPGLYIVNGKVLLVK